MVLIVLVRCIFGEKNKVSVATKSDNCYIEQIFFANDILAKIIIFFLIF